MDEDFGQTGGGGGPCLFGPEQLSLLEGQVSSDLDAFVGEVVDIARSHPDILGLIEADQDRHGLKKKALREADRRYYESGQLELEGVADGGGKPGVEGAGEGGARPGAGGVADGGGTPAPAPLEGGRPRMPALAVLVLLLLRGWIGGPKGTAFRMLLKESITLRSFFGSVGLAVPAPSTVAENLNAVGEATLGRVHKVQLGRAAAEGLDNLQECRADSTAVRANSMHPCDSGLMKAFAGRLAGLFERLVKRGGPDLRGLKDAAKVTALAAELGKLAREIGLLSGKRKVETERKGLYTKMYTRAARLCRRVGPLLQKAREKAAQADLAPSKGAPVQALLEQADEDLRALGQVNACSRRRVLRGKHAPAGEKIYSHSDPDAAIIRKGGREDVFGYRPQLAFSANGLLTALVLPRGNAADNGQLGVLLEQVQENTGAVPKLVTLDDGYTDAAAREHFLQQGVEVFSFAGAKGKAAIGEQTYQSEDYCKARRARAAAESFIYTLKHAYGLGRLARRAIGPVRHEMLEAALAYNVRRVVRLREDRERRLAPARAAA